MFCSGIEPRTRFQGEDVLQNGCGIVEDVGPIKTIDVRRDAAY